MGGKLAMGFALKHNERVSKLLIVDISPIEYKENQYIKFIRALSQLEICKFKSKLEFSNFLREMKMDIGLINLLLKNTKSVNSTSINWKINIEGISCNLDKIMKFNKVNINFEKPVLFIKGGKSDYILPEHYHVINNYFSNSSIQVVKDSSHWIHSDQPKEFMQIVLEFINK